MVIGEAYRALSREFWRDQSDEVWALAAGLRNVIVHEYFGVDPEVVWQVVERDLPDLKRKVIAILAAGDEPV